MDLENQAQNLEGSDKTVARIRKLQANLNQDNLPEHLQQKVKDDLQTSQSKVFEMEKYGLPDNMIAIDMSAFGGKSALDVMNE